MVNVRPCSETIILIFFKQIMAIFDWHIRTILKQTKDYLNLFIGKRCYQRRFVTLSPAGYDYHTHSNPCTLYVDMNLRIKIYTHTNKDLNSCNIY